MPNIAAIDFDLLLENVGDTAFAVEILGDFLQLSRPMIETLQGSTEQQSAEQLRALMHKFKGSAGSIAAEPLRAALEHLESCVHCSDGTVYEEALRQVSQQYAHVEEACRELTLRYSDSGVS
ncbi:MAG: Hpt domain-containing protein [Oceanococcus sp.]